jgi:hypothetical protein
MGSDPFAKATVAPIRQLPDARGVGLSQYRSEVVDGPEDAFAKLNGWLPAEHHTGPSDIGLSHLGVVGRKREADNGGPSGSEFDHQFRQLTDRELLRVPDIGRF